MSIVKQAVEKYDGRVIPYTCVKDVIVGDVIALGNNMVGIAVNSGLVGETISLEIEKVWIIKAKATDVINVGDSLYWDDVAKELTLKKTDNTYTGKSMVSKGANSNIVEVKINV